METSAISAGSEDGDMAWLCVGDGEDQREGKEVCMSICGNMPPTRRRHGVWTKFFMLDYHQ